jgi:hypothetical protein
MLCEAFRRWRHVGEEFMDKSQVPWVPQPGINLFKAFPPDRDGPTVQFMIFRDGGVDVPADVSRDQGKVMLRIYCTSGAVDWEYDLSEFLLAAEGAREILGEG